jgi:hypothetical protein
MNNSNFKLQILIQTFDTFLMWTESNWLKTGSSEHHNGPLGFTESREFIYCLNEYLLASH